MNTNCCSDDTSVTCAEPGTSTKTAESYSKPRYRVSETEGGYALRVYVPGVGKSGASLSLSKDVLTISAKRSDAAPEGWQALSTELPSEDYRLKLVLDTKIDADRITAKLENGVLEVVLPFKEAVQPRVIDVN